MLLRLALGVVAMGAALAMPLATPSVTQALAQTPPAAAPSGDAFGESTTLPAKTIFTATDDTGFTYQAAIPVAEAPKNPPRGDIAVGQSPSGQALKFLHRGSYDSLDN